MGANRPQHAPLLPRHIPGRPEGKVHGLDGQVLLPGWRHDADTTLHLAELIAGVPYGVPRHCMVWDDGRPVRTNTPRTVVAATGSR